MSLPHLGLAACKRLALAALCLGLAACAAHTPTTHSAPYRDPIELFPMDAYDQTVDHWTDPASPGYDTPFFSEQQQRAHLDSLYAHYFGLQPHDASPWNPAFIAEHVYGQGGRDIVDLQLRRIGGYDNEGKRPERIGYGQNYRPHTSAWIDAIEANMDVAQFARAPRYAAAARAIATDNLLVRELPTADPSFYSRRLAGEGYPFDNLQITAVRPGTPLYLLGHSADRAWDYVQTPDVQGWVQTGGVALIDDAFANSWRAHARTAWAAVIAAIAPVRDDAGIFRFNAPAGTLLPLATQAPAGAPGSYDVLLPARDIDAHAVIRQARMPAAQVAPMPFAATPRHLALLIKSLIGRPYGWGNAGFYNDCSSELQSIFAAFGVWLPRHSSTQVSAGSVTDLSDAPPDKRIAYLVQHGAPMRTLVYIRGHIMLYLGNVIRDGHTVPLVYQDIWGLRPANDSRRAVIGGSVIFPLLLRIPEDSSLQSLAATPVFQISILGAPSGSSPAPDEAHPAN
ncbi:SH3 domain-containing protein [Trinickia sp. LjRoot230]|uniref:SH3 domain-containing protein n=1 Tax=Trinickia sp. LjRoot230 TaxID=3342288 RepID=UPI003ECDF591